MDCKFTFNDINEYADGTMSKELEDKMKDHLGNCKECRRYYDSIILSSSYMKQNFSFKSDISEKVLQRIDNQRYKGKKFAYRFGWVRPGPGWIMKSSAAIACFLLLVIILNNQYVGSLISSGVSKMLEQKQQNYANHSEIKSSAIPKVDEAAASDDEGVDELDQKVKDKETAQVVAQEKDMKLLQMMFPNFKFELDGDRIITYDADNYLDYGILPDKKSKGTEKSEVPIHYFIERVEKGRFLKGKGENSLLIARRDGLAHADGFYHAYVAVYDESDMKLLSPVKHFFADEGKISIFKGGYVSYVLYVGSVTYQGWTDWNGGLWKLEKEWIKVWPLEEEFWKDKAVEVNENSITVLNRKIDSGKEKTLPDYSWEYSYRLNWDPKKEQLVRLKK